jgi:hypothetical protein
VVIDLYGVTKPSAETVLTVTVMATSLAVGKSHSIKKDLAVIEHSYEARSTFLQDEPLSRLRV